MNEKTPAETVIKEMIIIIIIIIIIHNSQSVLFWQDCACDLSSFCKNTYSRIGAGRGDLGSYIYCRDSATYPHPKIAEVPPPGLGSKLMVYS